MLFCVRGSYLFPELGDLGASMRDHIRDTEFLRRFGSGAEEEDGVQTLEAIFHRYVAPI